MQKLVALKMSHPSSLVTKLFFYFLNFYSHIPFIFTINSFSFDPDARNVYVLERDLMLKQDRYIDKFINSGDLNITMTAGEIDQ